MNVRSSGHRMLSLARTRSASRAVAVLTAAALACTGPGCSVRHWKAVPIDHPTVGGGGLTAKTVRLLAESGPVTLVVRGVAFPFIEGEPLIAPDSGLVAVDLRRVHSAWTTQAEAGGAIRVRRLPLGETEAPLLAKQQVQFVMDEGNAALSVERVAFPNVIGRPAHCFVVDRLATADYSVKGTKRAACSGWVRVDLRDVQRLEVREKDSLASAALGLTIAAVLAVALALIAKSVENTYCPLVYVEGEGGLELVGEGYAGAMSRSLQRDDLLPLPWVGNGVARVRLHNAARQVQHTDRTELVLVDHAPGLRALSLVDAEPVIVGEALPPLEVRDLEGRVVTPLVDQADQAFWQSDLEGAVSRTEPPTHEGLVASFPAPRPGGRPVLEIVATNSGLLEQAFGRYFAAMGSGFARYQAAADRPESGPRLMAWREREGVDLTVEAHHDGRWERVAVVPSVGPATSRRVAIALPTGGSTEQVELRLLGGLGFWRIDQLALSTRHEGAGRIHRLRPSVARDAGGRDEREPLRARDGRYQVLGRPGESLELAFPVPPLPQGQARTAFLFTSGYYDPQPAREGEASPRTVRAIENEPGGLSRLALDLAREYLRLWRETPRLGS